MLGTKLKWIFLKVNSFLGFFAVSILLINSHFRFTFLRSAISLYKMMGYGKNDGRSIIVDIENEE
jgi:hypothetical protein